MKVLSGIHEPTKGTITINNINYNKLDHKLAAQLGIGIIYQELSVIDELTVLEKFIYWSSSDEKKSVASILSTGEK